METQTSNSTPELTSIWKQTGAGDIAMGQIIEMSVNAQQQEKTNAQLLNELNKRFGDTPTHAAPSASNQLNA